jgi:8-oxo-dGTP diphosphatase
MSESTPSTGVSVKLIHVMAGAVLDADGRVLVAKRPDHVHQGGLWEFPGGKLEAGESPEQGLARELDEEVGIQIQASQPLIRVHHDYGDRHVLLDVRRVDAYVGVPHGREGQPLDWLHPEAMDPASFPLADRPVINALRLPPQYLITGADPRQADEFLVRLRRALEQGIRLVQLRAHELDDIEYGRLAGDAYRLCERHRARLMLNRDPRLVGEVPRHGLHLTATALQRARERPGRPNDLIGASCHDAAQLAYAAQLDLDYAILSPVKPTATHPDAPPLGWPAFAALVDPVPLPVYALGGLTPADLRPAIEYGAQGIAAIRGLWSSAD